MMLFPIGIEHALDVPVKRLHDADARKHRRPAYAFGDQDQGLNGCLPFLRLVLCFRKLRNVAARVLKSDKLTTAGQRDRIVELAFPTPAANDANPFCRIRSLRSLNVASIG
jgi:hypothetical protein